MTDSELKAKWLEDNSATQCKDKRAPKFNMKSSKNPHCKMDKDRKDFIQGK